MEKDNNNGDDTIIPTESQKHLTLSQRKRIEEGVTSGEKKSEIAKAVHKDKSSVAKEIKNHRELRYRCQHLDCLTYSNCNLRQRSSDKCTVKCLYYQPFVCMRRDRTPGACNGCYNYKHCRHDKYWYSASEAEQEYKSNLSGSRRGVRLDSEELQSDANILSKALKNGVAIEPTVTNNQKQAANNTKTTKLHRSSRTYYRYVHDGTFYGCAPNIDLLMLRVAPGRKPRKRPTQETEPHIPPEYICVRNFDKFAEYLVENPQVSVVEMDTVMNDPSGPYIQTFLIRKFTLLIAFLTPSKSAASMVAGMDKLEELLGPKLFRKYVQVVLTDQGTEFSDVKRLEEDEFGNTRTKVFYCNAGHPWEKPKIERKHELLRYVVPKHKKFETIGLTSQEKLNLVLSNVDSYPSKDLEDESPLAAIKIADPELYEALANFGIRFIELPDIILNERVLKDKS